MLRIMPPGCGAIRPGHLRAHEKWMRDLDAGGYLMEAWRCDLASGIFQLGRQTATLLGASTHSCGIIDLVRAYDPEDRSTVLTFSSRRPHRRPRSASLPWCVHRLPGPRSSSALAGQCSIRRPARICCKASSPSRGSPWCSAPNANPSPIQAESPSPRGGLGRKPASVKPPGPGALRNWPAFPRRPCGNGSLRCDR